MIDEALVERARALAPRGGRAVLGICGAPGAGKSTLAARLVEAVGPAARARADGRLPPARRRARPARARRPQGRARDLRRRRVRRPAAPAAHRDRPRVYAPEFDRSREESVAGAIAVRPEHRLVVTEGNYLLLDDRGWRAVRPLLDEAWFVEGDEDAGCARLVRRHVDARQAARRWRERWATESDQANADLVARTRSAADLLVDID